MPQVKKGGADSAELGPFDFPIDFCIHLFGFTFILTPQPSKAESEVRAPPGFFGVPGFRGRRAEVDKHE